MFTMTRTMIRYLIILLSLVGSSAIYATEQLTTQQPSWPWWHEGHSHSFWWIFPLMFFIFMIVMFIFMTRRGCMGCMWRDRMIGKSDFRDATKRNWDEHSESAQEILDKRYAKGEIDKQEYEEKKAAIAKK